LKFSSSAIRQFGNQETMVVSEELDRFFDEKMREYPTRRSFLVPMLLYTQDELGYVTDEAVTYLANKTGLTELEIRNVISYYSMLTTKPRGRYNLQVCTNISCMLRGAEGIFEHCKSRLGIGHKGTTKDGLFSLEEVECIGACSWAPAMQVNYDFHENLTTEKVDKVLEDCRKKGTQ
jgi:NADH-quinone oxidoreductase subunit E